ncbi:glycoside hydrolase family 3 N-terminal domain-containing protein [Streptomyces sp. A475]|uniref:glycoside hydrolase family 3 protein n=1 Tax=Streptomyces sp. A475 TaxID=3131976 RepID=UPI0030C991A6
MPADDTSRPRHPYQDSGLDPDRRVEDLLSRLELADKAGLMFHSGIPLWFKSDAGMAKVLAGFPTPDELVRGKRMNHFTLQGSGSPREMAQWHNDMQQRAEQTPLGIPLTFSTDPRNAFSDNPATSLMAGAFSQWPETTGLAAIGSEDLVERHADMARQEYLAVGIRVALHPQIDLATEPRWCRINGTFGADADLTSRLVRAYIRGFQKDTLGPASVATMTKHFPGGGPQKDGEDPHFDHGREQIYPGGAFDYHLAPFRAALEAGTTQIMPYYGMPVGTEYEEVGFGFNKGILTGLLRERLGFDGIVCTDFGLLNDMELFGDHYPARAWGVEHMSVPERAAKIIDAGADQFGGEHCPDVVVDLVRSGRISEARLDESVRRILKEKFQLGLFDSRYVDVETAVRTVGRADFAAAGAAAQRAAMTLLTNGHEPAEPLLPLTPGRKVFVQGVNPEQAARYATVVATPAEADVAIVRLQAPFEARSRAFEDIFHAGRLWFTEHELAPVLEICRQVPTVVDIYLDRPAVVPELATEAVALIADFGADDQAVLAVLFGEAEPKGSLPFELPSSEKAVLNQPTDLPHASADPLFPFGHGLRYSRTTDA